MEEGNERLSIGGSFPVTDIPVVDLGLSKDAKPDQWIGKITEAKEDAVVIYTDGSMRDRKSVV